MSQPPTFSLTLVILNGVKDPLLATPTHPAESFLAQVLSIARATSALPAFRRMFPFA